MTLKPDRGAPHLHVVIIPSCQRGSQQRHALIAVPPVSQMRRDHSPYQRRRTQTILLPAIRDSNGFRAGVTDSQDANLIAATGISVDVARDVKS